MKFIKTKMLRILLTAFMLAALVLPVIQTTSVYATAWYSVNWQYRKSFTVTNAAANFQTKVLIGETSGATGEDVDLGGFCQTDFDDIRFTGTDGITKLPYWIETITGTTPNQLATVWVKNNATPDTTLYIYYGNPSTTGESSGYNTFDLFDSFGGVNWGKTTGGFPAEHSLIYDNILYQVSAGDGIYMIDPTDGTEIHHWLPGEYIWASPVVIGDYVYVWNYVDTGGTEGAKLYKVNQDDGTSTSVNGTEIDFETLTTTNYGGVDLIFIPKGGYVTAINASTLATVWTSTVSVSTTTYHWDGGTVVGSYLYTRQEGPSSNRICKVNISDGSVAAYASLDSEGYYAALVYDEDSDQLFASERTTGKVKAFDASSLALNWTFTQDETPGTGAWQYHIMYSGTYYNGTLYWGNKESSAGSASYIYAINSETGVKKWKNTTAYTNGVVATNMVMNADYLFVPTHDYVDDNYHKLMVIDVSNGVLYDTINQSGDSACASPLVWGGKIFLGMWDTQQVDCRVIGSGQPANNPYKMDAYHTGYIGVQLNDYTPDKSPTDLSQWNTATGGITQTAGTMVVTYAAGGSKEAYSTATFGDNYAMRANLKTDHANTNTYAELSKFYIYATGYGYAAAYDYNGADKNTYYHWDGAKGSAAMSGWTAATYHTQDIIRNGATDVKYYIDDANYVSLGTHLTTSSKSVGFVASGAAGATVTVDWVLVRKYAATPPTFGSWSASSSPTVPAVTTGTPPAGIYATGATLQGTLTDLAGYTPVYCFFQYGISTAYGATTAEDTITAIGGFGEAISGLVTGQVYHYRAVVRFDGTNYIYGSDRFFTPSGGSGGGTPSVTTGAAVNTTSTTTTLQGTLDSLASYTPVYVYFQYGPTVAYENGATAEQTKTVAEGINQSITGLTPNTTYHFRAVVRYNGSSVVNGSDATFATSAVAAPTVVTGVATDTTSSGAVIQGSLSSMGGYSTLYVSFEYGPTAGYGSTTVEETITSVQGFDATLSGLSPEITYHFRARVRYAAASYVNGSDATFTTESIAPDVPVPGVDDPDILTIEDVQVYRGFVESGDYLFVISNKIIYNNGYPAVGAADYFSFQVIVGTMIRAQFPVANWGYCPGSVYVSSGSAAAIPWGSTNVTIRLIGNANKWAVPPSVDYALTAGSWIGTDLVQLDSWVLRLAASMQPYYDYILTSTSTSGDTVLSEYGGPIFNQGIPNLSKIRPHLFMTSAGYIKITPGVGTDNLQGKLKMNENLGTYYTGIIEDWGHTNIDADQSKEGTWGMMVMGGIAVLVVVIGLLIGILPALGACIPLVIVGMATGGLPVSLIMVVAAIIVMLIFKRMWAEKT